MSINYFQYDGTREKLIEYVQDLNESYSGMVPVIFLDHIKPTTSTDSLLEQLIYYRNHTIIVAGTKDNDSTDHLTSRVLQIVFTFARKLNINVHYITPLDPFNLSRRLVERIDIFKLADGRELNWEQLQDLFDKVYRTPSVGSILRMYVIIKG